MRSRERGPMLRLLEKGAPRKAQNSGTSRRACSGAQTGEAGDAVVRAWGVALALMPSGPGRDARHVALCRCERSKKGYQERADDSIGGGRVARTLSSQGEGIDSGDRGFSMRLKLKSDYGDAGSPCAGGGPSHEREKDFARATRRFDRGHRRSIRPRGARKLS